MNKFQILSWNVQGLRGALSKKFNGRVRQELLKFNVGVCDMICLQETHLSDKRIDTYGNMLKENWKYYWAPVIDDQNKHGGLCIALIEKWSQKVLDCRVLVEGRAQYIILMVSDLKLGFLNIYAPNSTGSRKEFWFKIGSDLPSVDHWCMVGDFNMIEDFGDRIRGSHALMGAIELVTWEHCCSVLRKLHEKLIK